MLNQMEDQLSKEVLSTPMSPIIEYVINTVLDDAVYKNVLVSIKTCFSWAISMINITDLPI